MSDHRTTRSDSGDSIFSRAEWRCVADSLNLSPRELELLRCCFDDLSEAAMAEALGISKHTVHTYMKRLFRKADVSSRVELIVRAFAVVLAERESGSRTA